MVWILRPEQFCYSVVHPFGLAGVDNLSADVLETGQTGSTVLVAPFKPLDSRFIFFWWDGIADDHITAFEKVFVVFGRQDCFSCHGRIFQ